MAARPGVRRLSATGKPPSVFDHVPFEPLAVLLPAPPVEPAAGAQTICGRIGHEQGVVSIVVGEQALASEGQEALYLRGPLIQDAEVLLETQTTDRRPWLCIWVGFDAPRTYARTTSPAFAV